MGVNFFRFITVIVLAAVVLFWAVAMPTGTSFDPMTLSWAQDYQHAGDLIVILQKADDDMPTELDSGESTITAANVNSPPILAPIGNKTVNVGTTLTLVIAASDPDGDTLAYSATNLPVGAVFDVVTQTFTWTPTDKQVGNHTVTFTVSDNGIPPKLDFEEITITVLKIGIPPIFFPAGPT